MTAATIFTALCHSATASPGSAALITPADTKAYDMLRDQILLLAGHLARNSASGPVAVLSSVADDVLMAFFACAAAGRPALVLDPTLPLSRIQDLLRRYGVRGLVLEEKYAPGFTDDHPLIFGQPLERALFSLPTVHSEAEFYWGLTSGSTGESKLFARSHRSWLESFSAAERLFEFAPQSRILILGPLSHSLFLYGAVHALCRGHTVVAPGTFRPDRAVAAANDATHIYVVPSMLSEMLDCGLADAKLKVIFSGGAKLSSALRERCETALPGVDLVEFYGASETSFITASSTTRPATHGSVGRPFPGVQVEIRDALDNPLAPNDEGDVYVSSPMLFSRYIGEPPHAGWFTAGDTGFVDESGSLHLTGRKNRVINSRGLKLRPEPIEAALLELPGVVRAAVVDLPDARRGAIAVAAVEFATGVALARRILSEHCRARVGARFSPQRYYSTQALPLTRSGKIAFPLVRNALLSRNPSFRKLT
jgi:long-chain acyl-CoA synthetase